MCDKLYTISHDVFCELFICSGKDVLCPICQQKIVLEKVYIATANPYVEIQCIIRYVCYSIKTCAAAQSFKLVMYNYVVPYDADISCFILSDCCVQCRLE